MKNLRLTNFDYSQNCMAYAITIRFRFELDIDKIRSIFESFISTFASSSFECDALVAMPDHVHIMIRKNDSTSDEKVSDIICALKSKAVHDLKHRHLIERSFWQSSIYEHVIRNDSDWNEKINYLLTNPIKAGLANDVNDYPFLFCPYVGAIGATQGRPLREGESKSFHHFNLSDSDPILCERDSSENI